MYIYIIYIFVYIYTFICMYIYVSCVYIYIYHIYISYISYIYIYIICISYISYIYIIYIYIIYISYIIYIIMMIYIYMFLYVQVQIKIIHRYGPICNYMQVIASVCKCVWWCAPKITHSKTLQSRQPQVLQKSQPPKSISADIKVASGSSAGGFSLSACTTTVCWYFLESPLDAKHTGKIIIKSLRFGNQVIA